MLGLYALYFLTVAARVRSLDVLANFSSTPSIEIYNASTLVTSQTLESPFPYDFPLQGQDPADLFPMPPCNGFTLEETTIEQTSGCNAYGGTDECASSNVLSAEDVAD